MNNQSEKKRRIQRGGEGDRPSAYQADWYWQNWQFTRLQDWHDINTEQWTFQRCKSRNMKSRSNGMHHFHCDVYMQYTSDNMALQLLHHSWLYCVRRRQIRRSSIAVEGGFDGLDIERLWRVSVIKHLSDCNMIKKDLHRFQWLHVDQRLQSAPRLHGLIYSASAKNAHRKPQQW